MLAVAALRADAALARLGELDASLSQWAANGAISGYDHAARYRRLVILGAAGTIIAIMLALAFVPWLTRSARAQLPRWFLPLAVSALALVCVLGAWWDWTGGNCNDGRFLAGDQIFDGQPERGVGVMERDEVVLNPGAVRAGCIRCAVNAGSVVGIRPGP